MALKLFDIDFHVHNRTSFEICVFISLFIFNIKETDEPLRRYRYSFFCHSYAQFNQVLFLVWMMRL